MRLLFSLPMVPLALPVRTGTSPSLTWDGKNTPWTDEPEGYMTFWISGEKVKIPYFGGGHELNI